MRRIGYWLDVLTVTFWIERLSSVEADRYAFVLLKIILRHAIYCFNPRKKVHLLPFGWGSLIYGWKVTMADSKFLTDKDWLGLDVTMIKWAKKVGGTDIVIIFRDLYDSILGVCLELLPGVETSINRACKIIWASNASLRIFEMVGTAKNPQLRWSKDRYKSATLVAVIGLKNVNGHSGPRLLHLFHLRVGKHSIERYYWQGESRKRKVWSMPAELTEMLFELSALCLCIMTLRMDAKGIHDGVWDDANENSIWKVVKWRNGPSVVSNVVKSQMRF